MMLREGIIIRKRLIIILIVLVILMTLYYYPYKIYLEASGIIYVDTNVIKKTNFILNMKYTNRILAPRNLKGTIEFEGRIYKFRSFYNTKLIDNIKAKYSDKRYLVYDADYPSDLTISIAEDFKSFWGGYNSDGTRELIVAPAKNIQEAKVIADYLLGN